MSEHDDRFDDNGAAGPARDELDKLLRAWHEENRQRAAAGRDRLLAALAAERADVAGGEEELGHRFTQMDTDGKEGGALDASSPIRENLCQSVAIPLPSVAPKAPPSRADGEHRPIIAVIRRVATHRASQLAAALLALAVLLPFVLPGSQPSAAAGVVMCPQGGRLVAFAPDGEPLGPCVLKHTDVDVDIAGPFARITLRQQYHNPNPEKIEAVYTFPMSHNAAVDGMKMVIGNRIVEGEVKERSHAQQLYAAAREQGRVASLLEQERPNIFTQSIANIEPGAEIAIEISYIEVLPSSDGEYTFSFPTTVAPRYIPGRRAGSAADDFAPLPEGCEPRRGLVLLAPAPTVTLLSAAGSPLTPESDATGLAASLDEASPIETPAEPPEGEPALTFAVTYPDGTRETGALFESGLGVLGGRWFYLTTIDAAALARNGDAGASFSAPTDEVPDAARITPRPARPPVRAGHDLSITVHIDTGGPGILDLASPLHEIVRTEAGFRDDGVPRRATIKLKNLAEIPNRDFVLTWRQTAERIEDQVLTAAGGGEKGDAGFFTLLLQPPERVADEQAMPRELLFVLDVSGSMQGQPIEKAKDVLARALASMRPQDRFNIVKFNNSTSTLWPAPRAATGDNLAAARAYFSQEPGGGGTEMMQAIRTALQMPRGDAGDADPREANSLRLIVLLSDGEIGNDMAVLDAVKNKPADIRFFTFSIGNAANRYLLDSMAALGGGKAAYVLQTTDAAAVADAFARRINTPVLTNVKVEFRGVRVSETFPPLDAVGDLYDVEPLVMHGRVDRLSEPGSGVDRPGRTAPQPPARIIITGMSGAGPWRKEIPFPNLPEDAARAQEAVGHDQIATLWARAKVESLLNQDLAGAQQGTIAADLKDQIVSLGERFNLLTQYTAFVAVDKLRVTVGGEPRLVNVPIELPNDATWEGYFGPPRPVLPGGDDPVYLMLDDMTEQLKAEYGALRTQGYKPLTPEEDAVWVKKISEAEQATRSIQANRAQDFFLIRRDPVVAEQLEAARLQFGAGESGRVGAGELGLRTLDQASAPAMQPPVTTDLPSISDDRQLLYATQTGGDAGAPAQGIAVPPRVLRYAPPVHIQIDSAAEQVIREPLTTATSAGSAGWPPPPSPAATSKKGESRDSADARARRSAAEAPPADAPREITPVAESFQAAAPSAKAVNEAATVTADASEPAPSPAAAQPTPPLLSAIDRTAAKIRVLAANSAALAASEDVGLYWSHPAFAPTLICELHVGSEGASGAPEIAAAFAEHFASLYPDDEILAALHATYQDDTLDAAALTARVRELADESWENILRIERLATLRHRLDPRLLALVQADGAGQEQASPNESLAQTAAATPADAPPNAARPSAPVLPTRDGKLLLSILVDDVAAAKQPLTDAGAKILATDETMRLIVAAAAPNKLADLALAAGVRRIEPASME